jgi:hypothetical protein
MEKIGIRDKHPGSATLCESNNGSPSSDSYPVAKELTKIQKLFDTRYRLISLLYRRETNFGKEIEENVKDNTLDKKEKGMINKMIQVTRLFRCFRSGSSGKK